MPPITDHPLRYELANELHARPFPALTASGRAVFLAIKRPEEAASRDRQADLDHLAQLLHRHGADQPQPGATHWFCQIGKHQLKWESHTEFVTYTVFLDGPGAKPFDPDDFDVFPEDWLAAAPGQRITSALIAGSRFFHLANMKGHIRSMSGSQVALLAENENSVSLGRRSVWLTPSRRSSHTPELSVAASRDA